MLLLSVVFFKMNFFKKNSGILSVANGLDPDQDQQNVGPDLGPNCLHRLSEDFCFVLFDSFHPSQQFFSSAWTGLPVLRSR